MKSSRSLRAVLTSLKANSGCFLVSTFLFGALLTAILLVALEALRLDYSFRSVAGIGYALGALLSVSALVASALRSSPDVTKAASYHVSSHSLENDPKLSYDEASGKYYPSSWHGPDEPGGSLDV